MRQSVSTANPVAPPSGALGQEAERPRAKNRDPSASQPAPAAGAASTYRPAVARKSRKQRRRRFTTAYKLKILREADHCTEQGQLAELLRSEGLYSSYLTAWRREREKGTLAAGELAEADAKTGGCQSILQENKALRQEVERLRGRVQRAEVAVEVRRKVSQVLQVLLDPNCAEDKVAIEVRRKVTQVLQILMDSSPVEDSKEA